MKELKLFFRDDVNPCTLQKCCLNALKNGAIAVDAEKFVIAESSVPDLETILREERSKGKMILINEGACNEENLLH